MSIVLASGLAAALALAPADEKAIARLEADTRKALIDAGQGHLELGYWCRKAGLAAQAAAEFLRAVEVSRGEHPSAWRPLAAMRRFEDAFFKFKRKNPSRELLDQYQRRVQKLEEDFERDAIRLATRAFALDLKQRAYEEFRAILVTRDLPLVFDERGSIMLGAATVPAELSNTFRNESILINGARYLRDAFLTLVPGIKDVSEATSERLRVRSERSADEAQQVLAIAEAELPFLEEECGGRPTRRMDVFVFQQRASFQAYCEASGHAASRVAAGLADGRRNVCVVSGEAGARDEIFAITLHEVAHLFQFHVSASAMPSWYREGFAETFGGRGAFTWDGKQLKLGGLIQRASITPLQSEAGFIPLAELLQSDAHDLMTTDKQKAERFYAEAWVLVRFLRTGAKDDVRAAFERWENMCLGAALGAESQRQGKASPREAADLFLEIVGKQLGSLELELRAYLLKL
ncbi:MAG: hypothetical protein U1E76_06220 [Planctomycetota bacterium]